VPLRLTDMEHTTVLQPELTQGPYCPDESAVESRVRENRTHGSERGRWKHDLRDLRQIGGACTPAAYSTTV
jgi:hypothetical protein